MASVSKSPSYLLTQNNLFYFRFGIPERHRETLGKCEIRLSLGTGYRSFARRKAQALASMTHDFIGRLEAGTMSDLSDHEIQALLNGYLRDKLKDFECEMPANKGPASSRPYAIEEISKETLSVIAGMVNNEEKPSIKPSLSERREAIREGIQARLEQTRWLKRQLEELLVYRETSIADLSLEEALRETQADLVAQGNDADGMASICEVESVDRQFSDFLVSSGLDIKPGSSQYNAIKRQFIRTQVSMYQAIEKRLLGDYSDDYEAVKVPPAPQASPAPIPKKESIRLSDAIDKFKRYYGGSIKPKTMMAYDDHLGYLGFILGSDITLDQISKTTMDDFFNVLKKLPPNRNKIPAYKGKTAAQLVKMKPSPTLAPQTVKNIMAHVIAFFNFAIEREWMDKNYATGYSVQVQINSFDEKKATEKGFEPAELKRIFDAPEYAQDKFRHPHMFWLPILALYTGARITELSQIHLDDIKQDEGVWVIEISQDAEGKSVKNQSSIRRIPIHNALIELNFINFVNAMRSKGHKRLFPELKNNGNRGYGEGPSKWFGRFKTRLGFEKGRETFHWFRHTLIGKMHELGFPDRIEKQIVGHAKSDITAKYGKGASTQELKTYMDKIDFGIDIRTFKLSKYVKRYGDNQKEDL